MTRHIEQIQIASAIVKRHSDSIGIRKMQTKEWAITFNLS